MSGIIAVLLGIYGVVMGSFVVCSVRRMRRSEKGKKKLGKRSVCEKCEKELKWYELVPVVSWVMQRGKCRECKSKIGWVEVLGEAGMGAAFVLSFVFWPFEFLGWVEIVRFGVFLVALVGMGILLIYDLLYRELPVKVLIFEAACAIIWLVLGFEGWFSVAKILSLVGGIFILGGIYFILYKLSHEKWVGGGDWILGVILAIFLGRWELALFALAISNFLACFLAVPMMVGKKGKSLPMGPFLIVGFLVVFLGQGWVLRILMIG